MPRARRRCSARDCDELVPCSTHVREPWVGSETARTESWAWRKLAKSILERDGRICHLCGGPGADAVDHLIPVSQGGTDDPSNLAAVHDKVPPRCHLRKTNAERIR